MSGRKFLEPFTGSAAVALFIMGAPPPFRPSGYAGNKRKVAPLLGPIIWPHAERPQEVLLADVGPWRSVWETFADGRGKDIIEIMQSWPKETPDRDLWQQLATEPPPTTTAEIAALYLFIQSRQANHAQIWIQPDWVSKGRGTKEHTTKRGPSKVWCTGGGWCRVPTSGAKSWIDRAHGYTQPSHPTTSHG